jgi:hypothetical protein
MRREGHSFVNLPGKIEQERRANSGEKKPEPVMDRRQFLEDSVAAVTTFGAIPAVSGLALKKAWDDASKESSENPTHLPEKTAHANTEESLAEQEKKLARTFDTGPLAGKPVHDLGADYLGFHKRTLNAKGELVSEALPQKYVARPDLSMERIWDKKELLHADLRVSGLGNKLIESYRDELLQHKEEPMNILEFMQNAEDVIRTIEQEQDPEKIAILYQLDKESSRILAELGSRIHGNTLMAFSMTEIMSSGVDAQTDAMTYDAVLRNNGARFVTRIPAVYDTQESFGPYQATMLAMKIELALTHEGKIYKEYRGASKMNRALPDASMVKIPEEYQNEFNLHKFVKPEHHHSFAYQFALHNIATVLGSAHMHTPALRAQLEHISDDTLTAFIATSHHKPTPSAAALIRHLHGGRAHDFRTFCPPSLQTYATRTLVNKQVLEGIHPR